MLKKQCQSRPTHRAKNGSNTSKVQVLEEECKSTLASRKQTLVTENNVAMTEKKGNHVPLRLGLSRIISMELGAETDRSSAAMPKEKESTGPVHTKSEAKHSSPVEKASFPQPDRSLHLFDALRATPFSLPTPPSPLLTPPSVLANILAKEEAWALLAHHQRQQQQQSSLQLEQLRNLQALLLLYPPSNAPLGGSGALPYLESFVAGNATNLPSELLSMLERSQVATPLAASIGANPGLLALTPKRSFDVREESIRSPPQDYQHLSKKAKRAAPLSLKVQDNVNVSASNSHSFGTGVKITATKELKTTATSKRGDHESDDADNTSDASDEGDRLGQRFRRYQYEQWTEKFQELCDFREERGHCQVPHTYKENPPLARWVKRQRYQYKLKVEGKISTMTDERVALLENIGFIWDSHAAAWAEKLQELKEYTKLRGDCNVPSTYPGNPQLATWVKCQRRQYKLLRENKTSNMTKERIVELEKVGFIWEVRKTWDTPPNGTEVATRSS